MRSIIGTAIFLFFFCGASFAEEVIRVDNQYVQEYKGRLGIWTTVDSQPKLNSYISKFYITLKEFQEINGTSITWGQFVFIPYSEKYIQELEAQGVKRDSLISQKSDFIWPLTQVEIISSTFGIRNGRLHTGTDMPATNGTPIVAVMDGRVLAARYEGGFGKTVTMEHRDNFITKYAHCAEMFVKAGDVIKKGQVIGMVGSTGISTGNHLHFEIRYNDIPLNPLDFLPYKQNLTQLHLLRNWK
ncbi:MAG: M23 family metallopeptidase [Spirochaetes bacterium]|nr:M23 family metallopeptidase [Spirochaetota bacterium]